LTVDSDVQGKMPFSRLHSFWDNTCKTRICVLEWILRWRPTTLVLCDAWFTLHHCYQRLYAYFVL